MSESNAVPVGKLILVPAILTFAVTLLRLTGELLHWSPKLFSTAGGGGGALVGIAWLVPVFGAYFGWSLARSGRGPAGIGRAAGFAALGLLAAIALFAGGAVLKPPPAAVAGLMVAASAAAVAVAYPGWPMLGRTLVGYGLAARIPVAVLMLFAILGRWGTHYDALPPNLPAMSPLATWAAVGLLPQLTLWIAYTVVVGGLAGAAAAAVAARTSRTA